MTCNEFKENTAAYALGALDQGERMACDNHLGQAIAHEGCPEALRDAFNTAGLLAQSLPPQRPGPHVWKEIEQRIGAGGQTQSRGGRFRETSAWVLVAAAAVALFLLNRKRGELQDEVNEAENKIAAVQQQYSDSRRLVAQLEDQIRGIHSEEVTRAVALLHQNGTKLVPLPAAKPEYAEIGNALLSADQKEALLVASGLKAPTGKQYIMWLLKPDGSLVNQGVMKPDPSGGSIMRLTVQDLVAQGFGISLESDAAVTAPTEVVMFGKLGG